MTYEITYGPHRGEACEISKRNGRSIRVRLATGKLLWVRTSGLKQRPIELGWKGAATVSSCQLSAISAVELGGAE